MKLLSWSRTARWPCSELSCPEYSGDPAEAERRRQNRCPNWLRSRTWYLDLSRGHVDLFGSHYWELRSPYREGKLSLNTGPAPREPVRTLPV